jgi:hypothetical protein
MAEYDNERRTGFDTKISAETTAVLSNAVFRRSPVLSKLLRFLVDETIKGHGDALKSYAVAVDGLGRPETFDSASDSSARVQMVRLRKALESYYAKHGPVDDLCLYLQPGSYRVRLAKLAHAYPQLYRPLSDSDGDKMLSAASLSTGFNANSNNEDFRPIAAMAVKFEPRSKARIAMIVFGALAGMAIAMLAWIGWQHIVQTQKTPISPVLELMPVEHSDTVALNTTAQMVASTFANDLPRFNVARIRVIAENDAPRSSDAGDNVYRLTSRLEEDISGSHKLTLRLNDTSTGTSFWSYETKFSSDPKSVSDALESLTADINGPFGVIAAHGSVIYRDRNDAGYACLLKYFSFVDSRATEIEGEISDCLQKPVREQKLRATMLAARALFTIERSSAMSNFDAAANLGLSFARSAVAADPNDASANFALARLSYLKKDCVSARFYTKRSVEANANSPLIMANLAALAPVCNYPDATALLDRAFLAQSARYPRGRLLLTLAALQQGRPDRLAEIEPSDVPQSEFSRVNYFLTEALLSGAKGNRVITAQNWRKFVAAQPIKSRNPDELLKPIIALRPLRQKLIAVLKNTGAFES